ncbi:phage baseplate assembly protein V, partial [Pseudomonas syringae]
ARSKALSRVRRARPARHKDLDSGVVASDSTAGDEIQRNRDKVIDIDTDTLNIKAAVAVNCDTPKITLTGKIVSQGDRLAAGISQNSHLHGNVQGGNGQIGPPVGGAG